MTTGLLKNLSLKSNTNVTIFDRYGKLLKQFDENHFGWDGTLNDTNLPADDYWFQLHFEDGKTIRGHFSLKR